MNACQQLLIRNRENSPEYGNRLTNHLPMALIALHRMGAAPKRLEEFYQRYAARLVPAGPRELPIAAGTWREGLGKPRAYADYLEFFRERAGAIGKDAVIAQYLPQLLVGLSGGAFHALIMLAYAIDWGDEHFLCESLAYFAVAYAPIPPPARTAVSGAAPAGIMRELETAWASAPRLPRGGNIIETMLNLAKEPGVAGKIGFPDWRRHAFFPSLTREALRIYLSTRDFTALHLVTSLHAMRIISRALPLESGVMDGYWLAFCLARLTIKAGTLPQGRGGDRQPGWDALKTAAMASDDDHVVKLVFTCSEEFLHYQDPAYLDAARLAAGKAR